MRRISAVVLAMILVAFSAHAAFAAGPPKPDDATITPPDTIGGVTIGQSLADAQDAWGGKGKCEVTERSAACTYGSPKKGLGQILTLDDAIVGAKIMAPLKKRGVSFTGPLMDFQTKNGLGLGSKLKKIAKKYDAKIKGRSVFITGDGVRMQFFSGETPVKHVTEIVIFDMEIEPPS